MMRAVRKATQASKALYEGKTRETTCFTILLGPKALSHYVEGRSSPVTFTGLWLARLDHVERTTCPTFYMHEGLFMGAFFDTKLGHFSVEWKAVPSKPSLRLSHNKGPGATMTGQSENSKTLWFSKTFCGKGFHGNSTTMENSSRIISGFQDPGSLFVPGFGHTRGGKWLRNSLFEFF